MFEWIMRPEMVSCLLVAVGMLAGGLYYSLCGGNEKTHWVFLAVTMILLVMCMPTHALGLTSSAIGFPLLFGVLFGVSSVALANKSATQSLVNGVKLEKDLYSEVDKETKE